MRATVEIKMKTWIAFILPLCLSATVSAQESIPPLLTRAAQCLEAKGFLVPSKSAELNLGYLQDSVSWPQENVLYVVEFAGSSTSKGWVFTVFLTKNNGRQVFNIQNNARFVRSKDGMDGIDFPDPPLGGTWTQEHIVSAIKKIQKSTRYTFPEKDLQGTPSDIQCESYVDSK
jgi:hypothetical protein